MSDARLEVVSHLDHERVAAIERLVAAVTAAEGYEALAEQKRLELARPGPEAPVAIVASDHGELEAYAHLARDHQGAFHLQVVTLAEGLRRALLRAAVEEVASLGGGQLRYWVPAVDRTRHEEALEAGFAAERDLLQLRRPLPVEAGLGAAAPEIELRRFRPGVDEEAWLAANNRAFAGHPEQGHWDLDTLLAREAEDWFDPGGFLLHFSDGQLAGACWTKVHAAHQPPLGEIYVIFVHPDHRRPGLGKALVLGGLDHLFSVGLRAGMLYVDEDNQRARRLYAGLGFTLHHTDRAYRRQVEPA